MKRLYISDLDGTLTSKSLVLEHAGHLINKGIMKDNGVYQAWCEDRKNEKLIVALAEEYRHQITGKTIQELDVENFVDAFLDNSDNWHSTLEMLTVAKDLEKSDIILITGSSDFLVHELCERLDFDYYATIYLRDLKTGKLTGDIKGMFADTHKKECIENNIDLHLYDEIIGLGDTASDYGIFQFCNYNILVEPTKETLEKLILKGVKIDKIIK